MKLLKIFSLIFLIFLNLKIYSQKNPAIEFKTDSVEVAINVKTNTYLYGNVTSFNFPIINYFFDSIEPIYYIKIQPIDEYGDPTENKLFLAYNEDEHKIIWQKYFNGKKSDYFFNKDNFVLEKDKKIYSINKGNGDTEWESKGKIFQSFPKLNIGLTFDNNIINNNIKLHAIEISSGKKIWTVEDVKYIKDIELKTFVKDSQFIFASKYLNGVNILTGAHWISEEPLIKQCMANYGTYGIGLSGAVNNLASSSPCLKASNILYDTTGFVFANFHKLLKYDYSGKLVWGTLFPDDQHAGISYLINHQNYYFIINSGFQYYNGNRQYSGFSFIAQYDKNGQLIKSSKIDHYVLDYLLDGDTLILLSNTKSVSKVNLNDINFIQQIDLNSKLKQVSKIDSNSIYIKDSNQIYHCIQPIDSVGYFIKNLDFSIIHFDKNFNPTDTIPFNKYTIKLYQDDLYTFITNPEKPSTFVLDSNMNPLFELNKIHKIYAIDNKYYFQGVKNFYSLPKDIFYKRKND